MLIWIYDLLIFIDFIDIINELYLSGVRTNEFIGLCKGDVLVP